MFIDVPAKVIEGSVLSVSGAALWPYNNHGDDVYWTGGASPRYYRWQVALSVSEQAHSSFRTRKPYAYNGNDISVGDWIADKSQGIAVKIVSITSKSDTEITCIVEDVLRYNTFRDPTTGAIGIFSAPVGAVIFQLNEEGQPILDPAPMFGIGTNFYTNLSSRFQNMEQNFNFILSKENHGFALGDLIAADDNSDSFVLANASYPYIVGTVSNVDLGPNEFMVNPFQKIVDGYPKLIGNVGSVIYTGENGELSLVGTQPIMIKIRQETNTVVTGSTLTDNAAVDPDSSFNLNGVPIVVGNSGSPSDFANSINLVSEQTHCFAELVANPPTAVTDISLLNNFSIVVIQVPASGVINGQTVNFTTTTSGSVSLGDGYADQYDIAADINAAAPPDVVASADTNGLILTSTNGPITLGNIGVDGLGNPFAGPGSSTGLALLTSEGDSFLRITGDGAVAINLLDTFNTPTQDFGLYSAENGIKAAALNVEQGIRQAATYVVSNLSARDALSPLPGDQAYVANVGNGEWAFYIYTLDTVWVEMANKDSSETDAQSVEVTITPASASSGSIHTISEGRRVSFVTVTVTEEFDGGATLTVGDDADNDRLMTADQNDLSSVGDYSTTPSHTYSGAGDTTIKFYFDAAEATVGSATIAITYT
jgi:hypothetical protein